MKPTIVQDLDKITNITSCETVFNHYSKGAKTNPFQKQSAIGRTNSSSDTVLNFKLCLSLRRLDASDSAHYIKTV